MAVWACKKFWRWCLKALGPTTCIQKKFGIGASKHTLADIILLLWCHCKCVCVATGVALRGFGISQSWSRGGLFTRKTRQGDRKRQIETNRGGDAAICVSTETKHTDRVWLRLGENVHTEADALTQVTQRRPLWAQTYTLYSHLRMPRKLWCVSSEGMLLKGCHVPTVCFISVLSVTDKSTHTLVYTFPPPGNTKHIVVHVVGNLRKRWCWATNTLWLLRIDGNKKEQGRMCD